MASSALLGHYSPCEALESPGLDMTRGEEEFLVPTSPDRSAVWFCWAKGSGIDSRVQNVYHQRLIHGGTNGFVILFLIDKKS